MSEERFTGKAVPKSISLPADMWALLSLRQERTGVPVSRQVRQLVEQAVMDEAAERQRARDRELG